MQALDLALQKRQEASRLQRRVYELQTEARDLERSAVPSPPPQRPANDR